MFLSFVFWMFFFCFLLSFVFRSLPFGGFLFFLHFHLYSLVMFDHVASILHSSLIVKFIFFFSIWSNQTQNLFSISLLLLLEFCRFFFLLKQPNQEHWHDDKHICGGCIHRVSILKELKNRNRCQHYNISNMKETWNAFRSKVMLADCCCCWMGDEETQKDRYFMMRFQWIERWSRIKHSSTLTCITFNWMAFRWNSFSFFGHTEQNRNKLNRFLSQKKTERILFHSSID